MSTPAIMITPTDFTRFPWMRFALQEYGQREVAGATQHNPRILAYHASAGHAQTDETPWCSAFVNWCMSHAGVRGTGRPNARSWLTWGAPIAQPVYGCVAVFSRPPKAWNGHVGFWVGAKPGWESVLGGNQSSPSAPSGAVCIKDYPHSRLLAYRWPTGVPLP